MLKSPRLVSLLTTLFLLAGCDNISNPAQTAQPKHISSPDMPPATAKPAPDAAPDTSSGTVSDEELERRLNQALASMSEQERALYQSCSGGELSQCHALAQLTAQAASQEADAAKSADLWRRALLSYRRACNASYGASCVAMGQLYVQGQGVKPQESVGAVLFKKACDSGHAPGCEALAALHAQGKAAKVKTVAQTVEEERKACLAKQASACARLGSRYHEGVGVDKDPAKSQLYFERACQGGAMLGCHAQGVFLMEKQGGMADDKAALALFTRACDAKVAASCYNAGFLLGTGRGVAKADEAGSKQRLEQACALKYAQACQRLNKPVEIKRAP